MTLYLDYLRHNLFPYPHLICKESKEMKLFFWAEVSRIKNWTIALEEGKKRYWGELTVSDLAHHKPLDLDRKKSI